LITGRFDDLNESPAQLKLLEHNYKKMKDEEARDLLNASSHYKLVKHMPEYGRMQERLTNIYSGQGMKKRKGGSIGSEVVGHRGGVAFLPILGKLAATALPYITDKLGDYVSGVVEENKRKKAATKKMLGEIQSGEYMKNLNKQLGVGSGIKKKRGGMMIIPSYKMMKEIKKKKGGAMLGGNALGGAFLGGEYLGGYLPKNLKYVGGKASR
jgi:hypothetical protein